MNRPLFEVCLEGVDGVHAAREGGADRVELCAALVEGGITPSVATITGAAAAEIDVMVMIRPRGGDFLYSERELDVMEADIRRCREIGVMGVVFGVLQEDGHVDLRSVDRLVRAAGPLAVTFHRAFDVCKDPHRALQELARAGVSRILTSGQRATVPDGLDFLKDLVDAAPAGLTIMPGCGITPGNVAEVLRVTGAREFHATAFRRAVSGMHHRNHEIYMGIPGLPEYERELTDSAAVRAFVLAAASAF